ncbi:MAG: hypothetical protein R3D69_00875 [Xanthobacteraceae bacterium]
MRIIPTPRTVDIPTGHHEAAAPSRALVPAPPAAATLVRQMRVARPDARFVAQLIATAAHTPQTNSRRRAGIADGVTVYGEVLEMTAPHRIARQGGLLSREA